jgi:bifunctional DNA-binding transcriptional regulator/antitoxin component of YhaV-PrlF toxin-antitoxin module
MDIVTVKSKFQSVIPQHVREHAHIEVGDFLEAGVENGIVTFTPKSLVDRHLAEGLEDMRKGRTHGPYASPNWKPAWMSTLRRRASGATKTGRCSAPWGTRPGGLTG